jgi:hypothetical protein
MNTEVKNDPKLIAYCGLYCAACGRYTKGKCPGCQQNAKATWCKIRTCNMENNYSSCANCKEFLDPMNCKKFNNPVSKIFALIFKSDRPASLKLIKEIGYDNYAAYMTENKLQVIKRTKK